MRGCAWRWCTILWRAIWVLSGGGSAWVNSAFISGGIYQYNYCLANCSAIVSLGRFLPSPAKPERLIIIMTNADLKGEVVLY